MTGRGRPHKAKSPENKCAKSKTGLEEMKQVPLPRYRGKDLSEEKHNGTTNEQELKESEQKKVTHTEKKPSVRSKQKETTTKHFTEEINKLQRIPNNNTKAPAEGTAAKTKAKSKAQCAEEIKMQPETPKDTAKASLRTVNVKTCGDDTKSPVEYAQETTGTQSQTQKDTKKASIKGTKPKPCAGKVKSKEKFTEETAKIQPEMPKCATNACVMQYRCGDNAAGGSILHTTIEKLKIKRNDRANAAEVINEIKKNIIKHLKENTQYFKEVEEPLGTGSYYENVKVSQFSRDR